MLPFNHVINSSVLSTRNTITTTPAYHQPSINNQQKQERQQKQKQTRRRTPTTTIITSLTTTYFSTNITKINFSVSSSISSTQHQPNLFEEPYSAKTGIKTAALLGGMLSLVILYLIWKARARICRFSSSNVGNSRLSATKFDLDYWLKQVDLLEAKEAERNRGGQLLYLELPTTEPRDNREATASWISDTYRHWRLLQYRQEQQFIRDNPNQSSSDINPIPYRKRRHFFRRLARRFLASSHQYPSFLMDHSSSLIAGMRPSVVSNNFIPLPLPSNLQPRRAYSWPRLKSTHHQTGAPMSVLQTHLSRKRLLKRASRTTFDI